MARLDPEEGFKILKDRVAESVKEVFPIEGAKHTLRIKDVRINDNKDIEDLRSQKKARMDGTTWSVPVEADMELVDTKTGEVVDTRTQRIMSLPRVTSRYSYIVDGHEYQLDNQWRLKPGPYSRVNQRGEFETMFNLKGRSKFDVNFDPKTAQFVLKKDNSQIPLYPILREMGVSDEQLEKGWGKDVLDKNRVKDSEKALAQFYRAGNKAKPADVKEARAYLEDFMAGAKMDPEVAKLTIGAAHDTVKGDSILMASNKLLGISRGDQKPDARDSLMFKTFHSAEDFIGEAIRDRSKEIARRIGNNLNRKKKVADIIGTDVFNRPIQHMFTKTTLSNSPDQTNPLEMVSGAMKTTIMGEGGIKSEHKITQDAKLIDPSHLGFLDPIHTPEGGKTGVTLHLPMGATKKGNKVTVKMWSVKTGKMEDVDPAVAYHSNIVLPDQVRWDKGVPTPISKKIKFSGPENDVVEGKLADADYVMAAPAQLFSVASNLIPFMQNTSANRSTMAGRHMEQAIPLKQREKPLVETVISSGKKETSVGEFLGRINAHRAPVAGEVVKITSDAITVKGADGKRREVQIYDNFPLNDDKGFMNSEPTVKVGDKVKAGQNIADTNFTKDGGLALGTNLRAAYTAWKGYNFEDGVVISQTAAQKLTSEHMHRKGVDLTPEHKLEKKRFVAEYGHELTKEQMEKLDDNGVIKPGSIVKPGDVLVAALRKREHTDETRMMARMHKSLVRPYDDVSVRWEGDHPGVVANIVNRGKRAEVHVKTEEPAEIGDKLAGRHGNKGIITKIIPDHEMPTTKDGQSTHILLNPAGIPGRLNLGQVLETSAAKIAEKTGKQYHTQNFDGSADQTDKLRKDLADHGIEDKEDIFDPTTGKKLGQVLVGPQYIQKLKHQVGKKLIARAGGPGYAYDVNRIPKGGGPHGAQALDTLGVYAMLAHGANANIREMQTYKSNAENNDDLWSAIQSGEPLPPPRPSFAYNKFVGMLRSIGVNTVKEGNSLRLQPLTDKQVLEMSNGEIKDGGRMVVSKTMKEEKNGIFDPTITGGLNGNKWSHIKLPEPMPNPMFEKAIVGVTGLAQKDFNALMDGSKGYDPATKTLVDPEKGIPGNKAVQQLLKSVDVKKDLSAAEEQLKNPKLKGTELNKVHGRVKYLRALDKLGMSPDEAYMQRHVAVTPPVMRPMSVSPNGNLIEDDANHLYKGLSLISQQLQGASKALPDDMHNDKRAAIYEALQSMAGLGGSGNAKFRGVLDVIRGKTIDAAGNKSGSPRDGFFQSKLIKRKQDFSMRSTIIPEPELGLDQVGIPRKAAMELYKPFVVQEMRGFAQMSPLKAQQAIKDGDPLAMRALERVVSQRPLLLKRDPVLHKYGVQAFQPVLTGGKAMKIHPLVTSGYNADFDGDAMSAFVPLSSEAIEEAKKMFPSNNLFAPATGKIMYAPTHESQLGIYTLTQAGKNSSKTFANIGEAAKAAQEGTIGMTDIVRIGSSRTSVGRSLVAQALPSGMRADVLAGKMTLDGDGQKALLTRIGKEHKNDYGEIVNKLKDLGNAHATSAPVSIGLEDISADKTERNRILRAADKRVAAINSGTGKESDKTKRVVTTYDRAAEEMIRSVKATHLGKPSSLVTMMKAGVKPNMDAYRQIKMAPMLMMNAKGEVIPHPVRRSYSEGLDLGDYWTQMSGARKGIVQKVQSVQEPGYLTKQVMNSVMSNAIAEADCGTSKGISLPVDEKDIMDRYLASPVKAGKQTFPAGTLITPGVRDSLRNNKVGRVVVRSPLRCEHGTGMCAKCYGLDEEGKDPPTGMNVGIISGQAIGERATQLSMRTFHSGGTAPVGAAGRANARLTDDFRRVQELVQMYGKVPNSATLSTVSGAVTAIKPNSSGGMDVTIGDKTHYVPQSRGEPSINVGGRNVRLRKGMTVTKGSPISGGPVNPHEMLPLAGINKVQGYLSGQLYDLYKGEGIRRRNVETVVKSLTNLTHVNDPGDHDEYIRGDFAPTSYVQATNKKLIAAGKQPIRHAPVLKGVKTLPLDVQTDWLARLNHERQNETIIDAASKGWTSNIHGAHPIPAMAYGAEFGRKKPY
jgi:DNA-directed RNA polymerase subunit beta'